MNITARAQDFELSDAIDQFVHSRLSVALDRFREDVIAIDVFLKDENGPKGGIDKRVTIRVRMRNRHPFAVETTHEDLYAAVTKGVKRTKRAIRRHIRKSRRISRRSLRSLRNEAGLAPQGRA